jgi:hypothetical protein
MSAPHVGDEAVGVRMTITDSTIGDMTVVQNFALAGPPLISSGVGGLMNVDADEAANLLNQQVRAYKDAAIKQTAPGTRQRAGSTGSRLSRLRPRLGSGSLAPSRSTGRARTLSVRRTPRRAPLDADLRRPLSQALHRQDPEHDLPGSPDARCRVCTAIRPCGIGEAPASKVAQKCQTRNQKACLPQIDEEGQVSAGQQCGAEAHHGVRRFGAACWLRA